MPSIGLTPGSYIEYVVQWYCNGVTNADGGGNQRMVAMCKKALERTNIF